MVGWSLFRSHLCPLSYLEVIIWFVTFYCLMFFLQYIYILVTVKYTIYGFKTTNISSGSMLSALSSPQDWWVNPEPPRSTWILDSLRMFLCRQTCVFVGNVDFRRFVLHGIKWFPILTPVIFWKRRVWNIPKIWVTKYLDLSYVDLPTPCRFIHMHHDNWLLAKEVKWFGGPKKTS